MENGQTKDRSGVASLGISTDELYAEMERLRGEQSASAGGSNQAGGLLTDEQYEFISKARDAAKPLAWNSVLALWQRKWEPLILVTLKNRFYEERRRRDMI